MRVDRKAQRIDVRSPDRLRRQTIADGSLAGIVVGSEIRYGFATGSSSESPHSQPRRLATSAVNETIIG
jgi:hypothetical protein